MFSRLVQEKNIFFYFLKWKVYQNGKDWCVYRTTFSSLDAMPVLQNAILEQCGFAMNEWM